MIYCFDIDGTLCTNTEGEYEKAQPHYEIIVRVNDLYDSGHKILLYTARGSTTGIDWRQVTEQQLRAWGVKFHELFTGKPTADVYIDDKATNLTEWRRSVAIQSLGNDVSALKTSEYLSVTYSPTRAPFGDYPAKLAAWLLASVYKKPGRLLDLGGGRGDYLNAFSKLGFDVVGVDISPRANELTKGHKVEILDLEKDDLPFLPETFDFVFSKSVVEHMRNPMCLLSKARQVLRPGGVAVIMTPSWAHTYWGPFYIDHTHITPFTATSLSDALAIAGFESIAVSYFYQLPFLWRYPFLKPLVKLIAVLPLPYRPYQSAFWPDGVNKLIRFSKEVMLLAVAKKPEKNSR